MPNVAAEIEGIRREIDARQADATRFDQFLEGASDAEDERDKSAAMGLESADRVAEETLGLYGILTDKDWLSRLESSYLTADQKQQVRETAYVTLVSLADYYIRRRGGYSNSVQRSLDLLQRAQAFHQPTRAFYFVRAECRRRQGDTAAAAEDEKQFKAATARTAWDYYLPGHAAESRGDLDEAIRSYRAALRLQPNHYKSLFVLAGCFNTDKINRRPEAIQLFTACIALRPDYWQGYSARGKCYQALGQLDDAMTDFRESIRLGPGADEAHNNFGVALRRQGKLPEAVAAFRQSILLNPDQFFARIALADALHGQGKLPEAIVEYQKVIAHSPRRCHFPQQPRQRPARPGEAARGHRRVPRGAGDVPQAP